MRNVKVILIHNFIAPYRHPLFEELSKKVDLIVYYCSIKPSWREWCLFPRMYDYKYKVLPRIPLKTPIEELSLNPSILKEIIKNKPDVIVIGGYIDPTMWLAFAVAKLLKIPIVYWTEGIKEPQSILGMMTRPLRMLFVKKSNAVVVPGNLSKGYVISLGAKAEKVFIAPNAIDNKLFIETSQKYQSLKENLKTRYGLKNKIVVLYSGRFVRTKGIEYLLYAYGKLEQEHNNIALVLVGSGPLESYLKYLANSLHLNFKILRAYALEELIKFYSFADIFVLPTLHDVWGFVINEAMACGLPVIGTRASQAAIEMIRIGENGYIVKEADSQELYTVLNYLIRNPNLRKKLGEKARETVECEFGVSRMVEGFLSAIRYSIVVQSRT
jgi:glycosyltransferase involved in cell wall biosynthesis